jgi:adenylate kinase family enzyme
MTVKVYFSTSVRGVSSDSGSFGVKEQITLLDKIVDVTTRHMANSQIMKKETGTVQDDRSIFMFDQELLSKSDCVISDCSNPSLGVGFMIAQGLSQGKPILCLTKTGTKLSAMINGCDKIKKASYSTPLEFMEKIIGFLHINKFIMKTPKIFMCGPPGSGKSTISQMISEKFGYVNISSGAVVREIIRQNDISNKNTGLIKEYVEHGLLIPSELMTNIIIPEIQSFESSMRGFILDGYPPSFDDLQNLIKSNIHPDIVFYFDCTDSTAVTRQCKRKSRVTDNKTTALERVKIFRSNVPSIDHLRNVWFCDSLVISVNAEKETQQVFDYVKEICSNLFSNNFTKSFFPIPLQDMSLMKSTKFHIHVDGKNSKDIIDFVKRFYIKYPKYQGQIKVYPIKNLKLCSQVNKFDIYDKMMNFHNILDDGTGSSNLENTESFITGKMGDCFDYEFMYGIIDTVENFDKKVMCELEEYIYSCEYSNGFINEQIIPQVTDSIEKISIINQEITKRSVVTELKSKPYLELHHGFDLEESVNLQIKLEDLQKASEAHGFDNGGWFVFRGNKNAYRSNEFFNGSIEEAIKKLKRQTESLDLIIKSFGFSSTITSNIEIVHGIWSS